MIKFGDKIVYHPNDRLDVIDRDVAFEVAHGEECCRFIPIGIYSQAPVIQYLVIRDSGAFYTQCYEIDTTTFNNLVELNKIDNHSDYDEEVFVRPITVCGLEVRMPDEELL